MYFHTMYSHHIDQVARAMMEAGARLEVQTNQGFTPLMYAAQNGHDQVRKSASCKVLAQL